jgi:glycosyltransferase involved in cell wall biosynthesis
VRARDGEWAGMRPVLLIAQTGTLGGAERVLLDWSGALERPALLACPPGPLADAALDAGLEVVPLAERSLQRRGRSGRAALDFAALSAEIARLARRHRPAVVVASGMRPVLAAGAAPLFGAALVTVHHDLPSPAIAAALRVAARRGSATVAVSGAIAEQVRGRGAAVVIHPGVDLAHWALPDPPPGPPRALYLGALVPWKRPDLALEIAARMRELRLDIAGAPLAGDPPGFERALRERAARPELEGRVRFLGALDDPRRALAEAHALLHCADREPFGLALLEALAAGRPVAAPAGGGPLEILTPACGRLFAPGDAGAGVLALREVLGDAGAPAAARARARAFDGAVAARRFAGVVEAVALSSGGAGAQAP